MNGAERYSNRVVLTGRIPDPPRTRHSSTGKAVTRFMLEHYSRQNDAGPDRDVRLSIAVVCRGEASRSAATLTAEDTVYVEGFLSGDGSRPALALHALRVERIN